MNNSVTKNKKSFSFAIFICSVFFTLFLSGCHADNTNIITEIPEITTNCDIFFASYDNTYVSTLSSYDEIDAFKNETYDSVLKRNNNKPVDKGIIVSPYFSLSVNAQSVPVYAERSAHGIHSFCYIDVAVSDNNLPFGLNIKIQGTEFSSVFYKGGSCVCLPQSNGVDTGYNYSDKTVTASISSFGSFSFVFNGFYLEPLTVYIAEKQDTSSIFGNNHVIDIYPSSIGSDAKISLSDSHSVLYIHKGNYYLDAICFPSDSTVYFEQGAYIKVKPRETVVQNGTVSLGNGSQDFMYTYGAKNIKILGNGLIDYSECCGGETGIDTKISDKGGISFVYTDNIEISGLIIINSASWTLCCTACTDAMVKNNMLLGYRVFSDGIMMSNCQDSFVTDNFIRTGDDACECKSTGTTDMKPNNNIIFRYNAVWTDKANAYGSIYESVNSTSNIRFEHNSIGFALSNWSPHLGCCSIQMGTNAESVVQDIYFENMEIYYTCNPAVFNCYLSGNGGTVDNIHYKDITVEHNVSKYLISLTTHNSSTDCIGNLYFENIVSNGVTLSQDNYSSYFLEKVVGGYDKTQLHFSIR